MAKRMIIMLAAVLSFIAVIGVVKYRKIQGSIAQASSFQPPPEAVTTIVAKRELWRQNLAAIGTVHAVNGVTVSADVPGIVESIDFNSGDHVQAGAVLVRLDIKQERAQLDAARARLELARLNLERINGLRDEGIISQADHDASVAAHTEAEAVVGEMQATIARKIIRAPFEGSLGIRQIDLGQYLESGAPIVPLQSLHPIHVNFSVPQQQLGRVRKGAQVVVASEGIPGVDFKGRVNAVDSLVDASTRNVQIQAMVENPGGRLRPGMFVTVRILLEGSDPVVALPASAIAYAPYGDSVFLIEEMKGLDGSSYRGVRQQFVKLGESRGDQIAVLSGIDAGAEVVTSGVFKLRNKAAVQVNNETQPSNETQPTPQDN